MSSQRWISTDYRVTADGMLAHKRWLNSDNSWKTGKDLERERLKVELESVARRLLDLQTPVLLEDPRCPFCGRPESQGGGKVHDVAGHMQTFCCGVISEPCCEGTGNGPGF